MKGRAALALAALAATACPTASTARADRAGDLAIGAPPGARPPALEVTMQQLAAWDYADGLQGMPGELRALSEREVTLTGRLLAYSGSEAMLCASDQRFGACQGPDVHQLVRLTMPARSTTTWHGMVVRVQGTFHVAATVLDGYCVDVYQLRVEHLDVVR
jgi:hypothetical protein